MQRFHETLKEHGIMLHLILIPGATMFTAYLQYEGEDVEFKTGRSGPWPETEPLMASGNFPEKAIEQLARMTSQRTAVLKSRHRPDREVMFERVPYPLAAA